MRTESAVNFLRGYFRTRKAILPISSPSKLIDYDACSVAYVGQFNESAVESNRSVGRGNAAVASSGSVGSRSRLVETRDYRRYKLSRARAESRARTHA